MRVWVNENSRIKISFAKRAKGYRTITNSTILFLSSQGKLTISASGRVDCSNLRGVNSVTKDEVKDIIRVTKVVAKWFSELDDVSQIYRLWGVRP
jgi:hypothetical protein